jgi:hypothetical protein
VQRIPKAKEFRHSKFRFGSEKEAEMNEILGNLDRKNGRYRQSTQRFTA